MGKYVIMWEDTCLLDEWHKLFQNGKSVYIYGAAKKAAKTLYLANRTGHNITGFLVTDLKDNPQSWEGLPVIAVSELKDKSALVLVPHLGEFRSEIEITLVNEGYSNIVFSSKYLDLLKDARITEIHDEFTERVLSEKQLIQDRKSEEEKNRDIVFKESILKMLKAGNPDFGANDFYQSCELLNISGQRPTLYRVYKYGMEVFVNKNCRVLDIGCNSGFLDLTISSMAKSVTGVEFDSTHVAIANMAKDYLHIVNCNFVQGDFKEWVVNNDECYEVVCAFAVNYWLGLEPEALVNLMDGLLYPQGYLFFESHDIDGDLKGEKMKHFEECCGYFKEKGYVAVREGRIKDDGLIERQFYVFQKR